jgi:hypothetical protein
MREIRTYGSVRGASNNGRPYRNPSPGAISTAVSGLRPGFRKAVSMVVARTGQGRGAPAIGRRNLLRMAGALAAAPLLPRAAAGQVFSETTISQAAQDARRDTGRLARRADYLLRVTVADGPGRGAGAVRRFRAEQVPLARDLAAIFNGRVSEDDWLLVVPTRELDLVLRMQPLVIRLAPTSEEVDAALAQPLAQIEPLAGDRADDVLLTIALDTLGLERHVALFEQLRNDRALAPALKDAAGAVTAKRYGLAALERVMRAMVLPATVAAIAENLGRQSTRALYESLVVRFVPFIGWTYFVTLLLATIYYNRDTTAPVLR